MTTHPDYSELLETARTAAREAGKLVPEQIGDPQNVRNKGPRDLVTDTDHKAQAAVLDIIRSAHPDHMILAEEDASNHNHDKGQWDIPQGVVWCVDPVDGTTNFTTGLPMVCVSVGVAVDGEPVAGAIYDPMRDELFSAARGIGLWRNDKKIARIEPRALQNAVIALDWPHAAPRRNRALQAITAIAGQCRTIRSLGSAALALAYVASSRVHAYFNFGLQPWDQAAGVIMIQEAGGEIRRPDGRLWSLGEPAFFSGHPLLLDELLDRIGDLGDLDSLA